MSRTDQRDPHKTYNKMSAQNLQQKVDAAVTSSTPASAIMHFPRFLHLLGFGSSEEDLQQTLGDFNVRTLEPILKIAALLASTDAGKLALYLVWHCTKEFCAFDLPTAFGDAHFEFYSKNLQGQKEQKPRWKRALAKLENVLGEALGKIYVAKYFPESAKKMALEYVELVRVALEKRLNEVEWMTAESTRQEALKKMSTFRVKIGFPDKWLDFTKLQVGADNFQNALNGHRFYLNRMIYEEINKPTDREKWLMTPQTINAYYHPSLNEIVFPAAILQPPFFNEHADAAVNFGGMGAVIGHEMTHGFDDQGRKYDSAGNLRDWWTEADGLEYEKRSDVMVKQAEQFEVHGVAVKGKLTCGENIADLGGLKLAMRALEAYVGGAEKVDSFAKTDLIDGFSHRQRLFLSWAKVWAQNSSAEREKMLITVDPHGPNKLRVNGTVANIPEFAKSFGLPDGKKMVRGQGDMVQIW